ncbi:divalent cation tolerance protein [Saccharopolyspora kobensis]|uniref:Divalent cation tolerance protein n=1 Tax=Saccharopolyspora kobensis TaxID=146035 RepID=A0A1H6BIA4_9PSEU|nr:divalent-cation tolerance protein CutA [Saccharopolyspora kobensis]SEG60443.1 divalent cation tolerance protein [Saccharopolyspora kobensis]SFE88685.1 divalent cation tolerance protein [Saccharopolyspora kobensis]
MADHVQVVTTTDSEESAAALARGVVEAALGACVQVVPIRSFYVWEGAAQDDPEWQLQIKTSADRLPALVAHLKAEHGYEVPEIIATPIVGGSAEYLSWVDEQTRS